MGVNNVASSNIFLAPHLPFPTSRSLRVFSRGSHAVVSVNSASVGASLTSGRAPLATYQLQQHPSQLGAASGSSAGADGSDARGTNSIVASAIATSVATSAPTSIPDPQAEYGSNSISTVVKSPRKAKSVQPAFAPVPEDVIADFEHKLEADLQTVGVTLTAILGVIIFWRGVWSLLDHFIGDSVVGDMCCVIVGLTIVLYIRLSGMKIATFWPPS